MGEEEGRGKRLKPFQSHLAILGVLTVFFPVLSNGGPSADPAPVAAVVGLPMGPQLRMEPYFAEEDLYLAGHSSHVPALTRNMTVTVGQTAFLECRVRNLGAKRISWIRHRDVHVLSVGSRAFTTDRRFRSLFLEDEGRFSLTIRGVEAADEGGYECQISTEPSRSFVIFLFVSVPETQILGESSLHVEKASSLNLTCLLRTKGGGDVTAASVAQMVSSSSSPSVASKSRLRWYKDGKMLKSTAIGGRGVILSSSGRSASSSPSPHPHVLEVSRLFIAEADVGDSGNYTCECGVGGGRGGASSPNDTVKVHVLVDGESPNAWTTNSGRTPQGSFVAFLPLVATALFVIDFIEVS